MPQASPTCTSSSNSIKLFSNTSMAFFDDAGGFAFASDDGKLSIVASTWNTKLSQLARVSCPLLVMTRLLPNLDYIGRIVGKRPKDIYILQYRG